MLAIKSLPENLKNIGNSAFAVCSSITSLVINKKLESIEYRAFDECYGLAEIYNLSNIDIKLGSDIGLYAKVIHKDLNEPTKVKIYNGAEYYDDGVSKIFLTMVDRTSASMTIESDCIEIVGGEFEFCTNLTSITIPESVKKIGDWAFNGCSSLISVTIPNSVTAIGKDSFRDCSSLTSVTIPGSVRQLEESVFQDCTNLKTVTIEEGVVELGWLSFSGCSSLTSITIPASVKTIVGEAFADCTSLTSVTFKDPNGWGIGPLTDPATNAKYLTDTHKSQNWYKS